MTSTRLDPSEPRRLRLEPPTDEAVSATLRRVVSGAGTGIAGLVLLFTILTYDDVDTRWGLLTVAIGLTLFAVQVAVPVRWVRVCTVWSGIFYLLQAMASPLVYDSDFKHLPPNLEDAFDVVAGMPGIEGVQHVTTDAKGFRTTKPVDYGHTAPLRVFAIGGSTTEQIHLDDRRTTWHVLQEMLAARLEPGSEVVNTGVSGLRAIHHLATLRAIRDDHADIAVILVGVNDWNRHIRAQFADVDAGTMTWPFLAALYARSGLADLAWLRKRRLRNTLLGRVIDGLSHARPEAAGATAAAPRLERGEYYTAQRHSLSRPKIIEFRPDAVRPAYARELREIMDGCVSSGVTCLFVTQPHGYRAAASAAYRESFWMTPPNRSYTLSFASMAHIADLYNRTLVAEARRNGFAVCDIADRVAPDFENFYDEIHFNVHGARRVAELLLPCVEAAARSRPAAHGDAPGGTP